MANPLLEVGQNPPPLRSPFIDVRPAIGSRKTEIVDELASVEMLVSTPWAKFFALLVEQIGVPGPPGPSGAASPWVTDAYAASYTADMTLGWNHDVTATGNIAVLFPTGLTSGQPFNIRIIQDATGGREITLASGFKSNRPDPGTQEALTSCLISGIAIDATTALIFSIQDNIPA